MKSENYLELILNEYENRELTKEDLKSTLEHYAHLYNKEQKKVTKNKGYVLELLKEIIVDTNKMWETKSNSNAYIIGCLQGAVKVAIKNLEEK